MWLKTRDCPTGETKELSIMMKPYLSVGKKEKSKREESKSREKIRY